MRGERWTHHGRYTFHDNKNDAAEREEKVESDDEEQRASNSGSLEGRGHRHGPEHRRELLVRERESPETEVRRSMRYAVETELWDRIISILFFKLRGLQKERGEIRLTDGVNDLVDHDLTELKFFVFFVVEVLGDHSNAFVLATDAGTPVRVALVLVLIQGANSGPLSYATVAVGSGSVVVSPEHEGLEEQEDRDLSDS